MNCVPIDMLPTQGPLLPTQCSLLPTQCPLLPTQGPLLPTQCPLLPTQCPLLPTQGPLLPTQGPLLPTQGPLLPTQCPLLPTQGPLLPTQCPLLPTQGPLLPTQCPLLPTQGPLLPTQGPLLPTQGPLLPTQCPLLPTQGPLLPTQGPLLPTQGPLLPTQGPLLPTPWAGKSAEVYFISGHSFMVCAAQRLHARRSVTSYTSVNIYNFNSRLAHFNALWMEYIRSLRTGIMAEYPVMSTSHLRSNRTNIWSDKSNIRNMQSGGGGARTGIENRWIKGTVHPKKKVLSLITQTFVHLWNTILTLHR